ncbi:hypothetical protein [Streptomyces sp. NPDC001774]
MVPGQTEADGETYHRAQKADTPSALAYNGRKKTPMRSARTLFASAAAAAALALTAPGAYALTTGDQDHDSSPHSQHHSKDHDKPKGSIHTRGGALSPTSTGNWPKDKDGDKENGYSHDKPKGSIHTGGGGLADSGTNVTGAALITGGIAAYVLYRRRKTAGTTA